MIASGAVVRTKRTCTPGGPCAPPTVVPGWVQGEIAARLARAVGAAEFPAPPVQPARRLTVVARDELEQGKLETTVFRFDGQLGPPRKPSIVKGSKGWNLSTLERFEA
jgi:hypothetical protein